MAEAEPPLQRENEEFLPWEVEPHTPPPLADGPDMPEDSTFEGVVNQPIASRSGWTLRPLGVRPAQKMMPPGDHLAFDGVPNKPKVSRGHPRKSRSDMDFPHKDFINLLQPPLELDERVPRLPDSEIGKRNGPTPLPRTVPISQHRKLVGIPIEPGHERNRAVPGFEDMMHDLSKLIDELPPEDASGGSPLRSPAALPTAQVRPLASYNPSNRPTSLWRYRYRLFTPRSKNDDAADSLSRLVQQRPGEECNDFRNPYIRALQQTRKDLEKSADLMFESSPAMLLATERQNALAGMQVFEAEEFCHPRRNFPTCMPEPCVENFDAACRQQLLCACDSDLGLDPNPLVETHSLGYNHILGATHGPTSRSSVQAFLREAEICRAADREGSLSSRDAPSVQRKSC